MSEESAGPSVEVRERFGQLPPGTIRKTVPRDWNPESEGYILDHEWKGVRFYYHPDELLEDGSIDCLYSLGP